MTVWLLAGVSVTVNVAVTVPELPSVTETLSIVSGGRSSFVIVSTPCESAIVALLAALRLTRPFRPASAGRVAVDGDGDRCEVTPGANVSVPDRRRSRSLRWPCRSRWRS